MERFTIQANDFLRQNIQAFYHTDYIGYNQPGNPDYINTLKNTFNSESRFVLNQAVQTLRNVLFDELPKISNALKINPLIVCVIPRAKKNYSPDQLLFKTTVQNVVNQLSEFVDGSNYIIRHTDTKTTHLAHSPRGAQYAGDGRMPYIGITKDTCNISINTKGKDILLIDDLYTRTVNIDEDAIQALLDRGANSVYFYSIGKTVYNRF